MLLSDFDYDLPSELIAQQPLVERDSSRMLVVNRTTGTFTDAEFHDLPKYITPNDLIVLNNTRVFPARLIGKTETGAAVEIFLIKDLGDNRWETLAKPGRRLRPGKLVSFGDSLTAETLEKTDEGKVIVRFRAVDELDAVIDRLGKTPLPPYIRRFEENADTDRDRYQTVYASRRGAIAAPTAGLHFTPRIMDGIRGAGAALAEITLHVGYGTFEPVRVDDIAEHKVLGERYEIDENAAETLNRAKDDGKRIVAIGTTTTRALESNIAQSGLFIPGGFDATLTITPGYTFRAIDALLTNFHLPKSSLLILTSTFGGHDLIMRSYLHAVAAKYRFYSYGDCMLIV